MSGKKPFIGEADVMIDLETLGLKPGCCVLSIGAVIMRPTGLGAEFYRNLDTEGQKLVGLVPDPETVAWWSKQTLTAQEALLKDRRDTLSALQDLRTWLLMHKVGRVWGNGANFDNVILAEVFDAYKVKRPWAFYNDRCYRTLKNLHRSIKFRFSGTKHHALDDARSQAVHAIKILNAINGWETEPCPASWKVRLKAVLSAVFRKSF